ncbi:GDSL-type esterase/lipase family protein [Brevundimonas sp.]|uniref:GDSL-type esterase/lipase family protein n=1 Tax=Brevundimonas sp. TaxID=1871086 RepID=UPI003D0B5E67
MTDPASPFTPAVGMVDRLDSRGFGPSADDLAFAEAYLAPGDLDPEWMARLTDPERRAAREAMSAERKARDWPALGQYREANEALAGQPVDVVFIGDSITEFWRVADPALFSGRIVNRGISGQTSPQILLRFMADVVALKPKAVHILCGGNDMAGNTGPSTVEDYRNTILAMLTLAEAHGIKVILGALTPFNVVSWNPAVGDLRERTAELNAWQAALVVERGLVRADYFSALADADGRLRPEFHRDGVHPTRAGYDVMRPVAERAIQEALAWFA